MRIKLNCVLAELSKGFKPGMDHTSKTLALTQTITYGMMAEKIFENPPLDAMSGLTLKEMTTIDNNIRMTFLSITRENLIL